MSETRPWIAYAWSVGATAICTLVALAIHPRFDLVNVAMLYLLAVVFVALRFSLASAVLTAVLCIATFDVLFVPPRGTLRVDDLQYLLTFAIMLAVAFVISRLVQSVRRQATVRSALQLEAETERMRSALLASISHDLRTPLAVLAGASSSLAERGDRMSAEQRNELTASMFRQSRELSEHVAKVLQMTRLETGAIRVERDWVAIPEVAGSVLRRLTERLAEHRLVVEVPPDMPLVRADATLIEQALANLLENAATHTPPGTVVRLRAQRRDREVVVSVEDLGGGLRDEDVERVFARFHHGTVEGNGSGMGLGLAICRAIVRLHDGRAWAERVPGGGTAFRFALPLDAEPPTVPAEGAAA